MASHAASQSRRLIGQLTDRFVGRIRGECDALHRAGLERAFLATDKGRTYRAHPRYKTFCPGRFFVGDQAVDCVVLNISVGGAKVRLMEGIEGASRVRLRIEQVGELSGRVVWRDVDTLGIEFHDPLHDIERTVEIMSRPDRAAQAR